MNTISSFLEKFKFLLRSSVVQKELAAEIVSKIINVQIKTEDIDIKGNTLYVKTPHSALKSEIFLKKTSIVSALKGQLGTTIITDIR
jgi:hypothetical protein